MPQGNVPYGVFSPYEALLASLERTADQANCGFVRKTEPLRECFERQHNGKICFDCLLHLQEWAARKERVHILIHVQETIRGQRPNNILERSTVRVSYFKVECDQAKLLHSVHFDYTGEDDDGDAEGDNKNEERKAHPIFHAQLTNETVELSAKAADDLEFRFPQFPCSIPFKNARVPTSDMTLPSVLLCLAADHIKAELFAGFLSQVEEIQQRMPQAVFEKTRESLEAEPTHLRSSHWFAYTKRE